MATDCPLTKGVVKVWKLTDGINLMNWNILSTNIYFLYVQISMNVVKPHHPVAKYASILKEALSVIVILDTCSIVTIAHVKLVN